MNDYCMNCMEPLEAGDICAYCGNGTRLQPLVAHHLPPGTTLSNGRYLVGRSLGQGGFGITYIGRDLTLNMRVAVKEYYPASYVGRDCAASHAVIPLDTSARKRLDSGRRRFLDEARVLARFHGNPGIVDVRDFFEENGTAYIVMDYLEGETLKDYLRHATMSADQAFELARPIMDALALIHADHVVHRDISPDNIMLCSSGKLCLMDFGAAHEMDYTDQRSVSMVLKSGYAPEEQYRAKGELGPWTDIYALCATMYRAISGVAPDESLQRLISDEMAWPSEMGIAISPAQERVLKKGMAPRHADRYQSIAELQEDLATRDGETLEAMEAPGIAPSITAIPATIPDDTIGEKTVPKRPSKGPSQNDAPMEDANRAKDAIGGNAGEPTIVAEPDAHDEADDAVALPSHEEPTHEKRNARNVPKTAIVALVACAIVAGLVAAFLLTPAFTVSFDAGGGSSVESTQVSRIGTVSEPETPTRPGYAFAGWYLDEALSDKAGFPLAVDSNTTLFAAWDKTLANYRVEHLDAVNGKKVADDKTVENAEVGSKVTVKAPAIDGYALDSDKKVKLAVSENDDENVVTFRYRKLVSYEVRYRSKNGNSDVSPSKTVDDVAMGTEITETAPDIAGYTLQSDREQAITLKRNSKKNVIEFVYEPIPVPVDTGGGSSYSGGGSSGGGSSRSSGSNDVKWAN